MTAASDNVFPKILLDLQTSDPSAPADENWKLYAKPGGIYAASSNSAAGPLLANPMTASGDIIYGGASGAATRLAKGSDGEVLTLASGVPSWAAAGSGGLTHAYVGYNTIGGSTEALTDLRQYYKKVTLASDCLIESIGIYVKQVTAGHVLGIAVGVLRDNSGTPDLVLAYNGNGSASTFVSTSNGAAGAARWLHSPLGYWATAGDYWLSVCLTATASGHQVYYDGSGSDRYHLNGALRITDSGWTTVTTSSNKYSIRASTIS